MVGLGSDWPPNQLDLSIPNNFVFGSRRILQDGNILN